MRQAGQILNVSLLNTDFLKSQDGVSYQLDSVIQNNPVWFLGEDELTWQLHGGSADEGSSVVYAVAQV